MKHFILRRALQALIIMLLASFLTFILVYMSPSDPAEMMLSANDTIPTEEILEKTREEMGLNEPFLVQYGHWLKSIMVGNLGYSYSNHMNVSEILPTRIIMTGKLAVVSTIILVLTSLSMAIVSVMYKNKWIDYVIRIASLIKISLPSFWLGLILIYIFAVRLKWAKIVTEDNLAGIILPALTLSLPFIGRYTRLIRAALLAEYSKDYVVGAKARGIRERKIIIGHLLPNAMPSIITLLGLSIASLLGGTVIVENIFSWPGLGSMALEAITYRDYALLQAYVLFMVFIYVSVNLIVDILAQALDPRIRTRGEG